MHLCGPLGISRTVNLNCATNSPGHEEKENVQQILHSTRKSSVKTHPALLYGS